MAAQRQTAQNPERAAAVTALYATTYGLTTVCWARARARCGALRVLRQATLHTRAPHPLARRALNAT
eukprot:9641383-Lingulodinium_polyedra.AAC.1